MRKKLLYLVIIVGLFINGLKAQTILKSWDKGMDLYIIGTSKWFEGDLLIPVIQEGYPYSHDVIIKCSPDGKLLATGNSELVQIWDIKTGRVLKTLYMECDCIDFSPNSRYLAIGNNNGDFLKILIYDIWEQKFIKVINLKSLEEECMEKFHGCMNVIYEIKFSSDGRYLFTSTLGHAIQMWEIETGSLIKNVYIEYFSNGAFDISKKDNLLAVGDGNDIKIFSLTDWKIIKILKGHTDRIRFLTFHPDNIHLISVAGGPFNKDNTIKIWDFRTGEVEREIKELNILNFVLSPTGKFFSIKGIDYFKFGRFNPFELSEDLSSKLPCIIGDNGVFSPDGNLIYIPADEKIVAIEVPTGKVVRNFSFIVSKPLLETPVISLNERYLSWADYDKNLYLLDMHNYKIRKIWDNTGHIGTSLLPLGFCSDEQNFIFAKGRKFFDIIHGSYYIFDQVFIKNMATEEEKEIPLFDSFVSFILLPGIKDNFLYSSTKGSINLFDLNSNKIIASLPGKNPMSISPNGKLLAFCNIEGKSVSLCEIETMKRISSFKTSFTPKDIVFSPDNTYLFIYETEGRSFFSKKEINVWDISNNKLSVKFYGASEPIVFHPKKRWFAIEKSRHIEIRELGTWRLIQTISGHSGKPIQKLSFSKDGNYLISGSDDIKIWRIQDGVLLKTLNGNGENFFMLQSRNWIVTNLSGGVLRIYNFPNGSPIITIYHDKNSYLFLTPEGFFSGIGNFNKYVHFVKRLEVYDFNQFYDVFYRPDLVEKKLKGEDITKSTGGLTIEEAMKNPPPKVTILSPKEGENISEKTITVKVLVKDTGGQIGDIRIYHNGKLVDSLGVYRLAKSEEQIKLTKADISSPYQTVSRGITLRRVITNEKKKDVQVVPFTSQVGEIEKTYTITLTKGENIISASAFNGANTVMSAIESVKIKANIPERKPELFILSIGNNHFKKNSYNLNMAIKDAKDFSDIIKKNASSFYEKVHTQTLIDTNKTTIIQTLFFLSSQMKPEDVFIFFAATHGRAEDDIYYLYTSDFEGNLRNPDNYISSIELMEFSKKILALKQVFVLDTCMAGEMESIVSGLYDSRISVLAKSLGIHIFAGTKSYQDALDSYQGNGLFTYYVLKGFKGEADEDKNKEVTIFEMDPYLTKKVKEASKGNQEVYIRIFGEDLPVTQIKNETSF